MSVKIRFLLNLSSFTQGHTLLQYQHPPGYLKHKHAFHYDFWHDPKCDRNNFIQFWLMQVLTRARNLVIPDKQPSGDIIKSVGGEKKGGTHTFVHPRWSAYALNPVLCAILSFRRSDPAVSHRAHLRHNNSGYNSTQCPFCVWNMKKYLSVW